MGAQLATAVDDEPPEPEPDGVLAPADPDEESDEPEEPEDEVDDVDVEVDELVSLAVEEDRLSVR